MFECVSEKVLQYKDIFRMARRASRITSVGRPLRLIEAIYNRAPTQKERDARARRKEKGGRGYFQVQHTFVTTAPSPACGSAWWFVSEEEAASDARIVESGFEDLFVDFTEELPALSLSLAPASTRLWEIILAESSPSSIDLFTLLLSSSVWFVKNKEGWEIQMCIMYYL